jgi:23S rRNA G2445 N2-methylase RlmL
MHPGMARFFAITNRGLEPVSAAEMARLPGLHVEQVGYRRVSAALRGDIANLLQLRTVDDVFVELAIWEGIGPQRSTLEELEARGRQLDFQAALEVIARVRPLRLTPAFSVTANFVGRRNYTAEEIKMALAAGIAARQRWPYTSEDQSQVNLRVFIEHDRAYVGMRLAEAPLHRRPYKQAHVSGSLKPPVAAALLQIAGVEPPACVLDPFCGAGTILIEAALLGAQACGGDRDPAAVRAASANAAHAGVQVRLLRWEAQSLPLAARSAGRVVTNLPWGRQVGIDENMVSFYRKICAALARVIREDGQIVLLTNAPQLVHFDGWERTAQTEISLFGQTPSILQFSASPP